MKRRRSIDDQKSISRRNRGNIIGFLREKEETTRFEIASALSLSHTTIKNYIEQLLEGKIIEETGVADSKIGRKPVKVQLIANSRYSIGINLAPGRIDYLLLNIKHETLTEKSIYYNTETALNKALEMVASEIDHLILERQIDRRLINGVVVAIPGLVDAQRGLLVYSANLKVTDFDFSSFAKRTGLLVCVENEAQAAAFAEWKVGNGKGKNNLIYVSIAEGIGVGIIINKRIFRTGGRNAGEFGHVRVTDEPVQCNCGRSGCWEKFASATALLKCYTVVADGATGQLTDLFAAYGRGDPLARQVLEQYTRSLFRGIDIILLAFGPEEVIIGGDLAEFSAAVIEIGMRKLGLTRDFRGYEKTRISASALRRNAAV